MPIWTVLITNEFYFTKWLKLLIVSIYIYNLQYYRALTLFYDCFNAKFFQLTICQLEK